MGSLLFVGSMDKIVPLLLTDALLPKVVKWFHNATAHNAGITRLENHLRFHFHHSKLSAEVRRQVSQCDLCQRLKRGTRQYGLLAPRNAQTPPWHTVATDCVGPWVIALRGGREFSLRALTSIDITTNLLELEPLVNQTSESCAQAFAVGWLSRYPRPVQVVHDQGTEFMGQAFQDLLRRAGIKSVPTTARNPQGNSIIEAVHKSVSKVLRTLVYIHHPQTMTQAQNLSRHALATAMLFY